jgi:hypothetical protein
LFIGAPFFTSRMRACLTASPIGLSSANNIRRHNRETQMLRRR